MRVFHEEKADGSLTVTLSFTADEVICLKHDLPGVRGIVDWYALGPASQKVSRCAERIDRQYRPVLDADPNVAAVPADRNERIALIVSRPDYKDREARDADGE